MAGVDSNEQYAAVLVGESGSFGPSGNLAMGYTVAVKSVARKVEVMAPTALGWEQTRHLQDSTVKEAERILQAAGWRVSGDWECLASPQHWFAGDHGSWAASVVPITADLRRAGSVMAGRDLSGQDLTAVMYSGADLRGANLSRANLTRADLSQADLTGARLTGAVLHATDLTGANLTRADLTGTDLTDTKFDEANLTEADLSHVAFTPRMVLRGVNMTRAKLVGARMIMPNKADLTGADLTGANLQDLTIIDTSLRGAVLTGANFYHARLSNADLTGATLPDLDTIIHVLWTDETTWDPAVETEIRRRSTAPAPSMVQPQPRGGFLKRRKHRHESILNPLPPKEFEPAIIKFLHALPAQRRDTGLPVAERFWATPEEITVGVGELLGRPVPPIAVLSFLANRSSPHEQPSYTLFHVRQDGRYKLYSGGKWNGQTISEIVKS